MHALFKNIRIEMLNKEAGGRVYFTGPIRVKMNRNDLSQYFHRHCRVRLKSGKEIFGILWASDDEHAVYFSTAAERANISLGFHGSRIDPEEIAGAEMMQ